MNISVRSFIRRFTDGLFLDGRNLVDPTITADFFETQQRGELRYTESRGEVPFHPRPIPAEADADRMLYLYGSDYILNSLLYHAYQSDRLTMRVKITSNQLGVCIFGCSSSK